MGHVAPVVDAILVIRGLRRVVDEPPHAFAVDGLVQIIDIRLRRLVPFRLGLVACLGGGVNDIQCHRSNGGVNPGSHDGEERDAEADGDIYQCEEGTELPQVRWQDIKSDAEGGHPS